MESPAPETANAGASTAPRPRPPVKVLICNDSLSAGDADSKAVALANALAGEGFDVLFASDNGPLRNQLDARVKYRPIENAHRALTHAAHDLSHLLREERPDVVHSYDDTCALAAAIAVKASKVGCARVLTHDTAMFRHMPRFISGPITRRCADRFIAISRDRLADLEKLGVPGEKILRIPRFCDPDGGTQPPANDSRDDPRAETRDTIQAYRDLLAVRTP